MAPSPSYSCTTSTRRRSTPGTPHRISSSPSSSPRGSIVFRPTRLACTPLPLGRIQRSPSPDLGPRAETGPNSRRARGRSPVLVVAHGTREDSLQYSSSVRLPRRRALLIRACVRPGARVVGWTAPGSSTCSGRGAWGIRAARARLCSVGVPPPAAYRAWYWTTRLVVRLAQCGVDN